MVRIQTASRLHFGLLSLAADGSCWPDRLGRDVLPARRFGGVGLMVERPGLGLSTIPAGEWSAQGPLAERALAFARCFAESVSQERTGLHLPPQKVVVERCAPEHAGLGTGTQLGLAVGRALALAWGLPLDVPSVARRVGRGTRSALGIHGFEQGGFLVEGGQRGGGAATERVAAARVPAPLVARLPFPETWRLVLALAPAAAGLSGTGEQEAFGRLAGRPPELSATEALCRLVLLGLLPALAEADLEAFGEALFDFNSRVGAAFAPVQGGIYAGPGIAALVDFVRGLGVRGVGQSSWGPTVFAVVADEERATDLAGRVRARFGLSEAEVFVTRACNQGAELERE